MAMAGEDEDMEGLKCSVGQVLNCQFSSWYPRFARHTPRSVIVPLCARVVSYLRESDESGILKLPDGFEPSCQPKASAEWSDSESWDGALNLDAEEEGGAGGTGGGGEGASEEFALLLDAIQSALAELGGSAFPKLNWSCPRDAAWMNGGSLRCFSAGDVLALLKSSTFISHDLEHPFKACRDARDGVHDAPDSVTLVLRKWCNFLPSMHFRCFIKDRKVTGICQKDCCSYYAFLRDETLAKRLAGLISTFLLDSNVLSNFSDSNFVIDVYVDKSDRVWIIDFNPFCSVTDSLLFSWAELDGEFDSNNQAYAGGALETAVDARDFLSGSIYQFPFRVVGSDVHTLSDTMAVFRGPVDAEILACSGLDALAKIRAQQAAESSDSDDNDE